MMKKEIPAASPDAYVAKLRGWRKELVVSLRAAAGGAAAFEQTIKWCNIVFIKNGPAIVIRAEEERVLLSFFRGKRLTKIEPRLKPSGKYELATIEFKKGDTLDPAVTARLAREAAALNAKLGDPTKAAK